MAESLSRDELLKIAAHVLASVDPEKMTPHAVRRREFYRALQNPKARIWDFESPLPKGKRGSRKAVPIE